LLFRFYLRFCFYPSYCIRPFLTTLQKPGVQFGGDEVVKAKDGAGSATLSMAWAGFRFAEKLIRATQGESGIIEPTFVFLDGVEGGKPIREATGCDFFSVPVELGPNGAKRAIDAVSNANDYEKGLLQKCYEDLKGNIQKGVEFANK
jgi:malate dehydrogenase